MVNRIKLFRDNKIVYVPITEWFEENFVELPFESKKLFKAVERIFEIRDLEDYKKLYDFLRIDFNYHRILIKYEELIRMRLPFDQDIIKFIAFLFGTSYFGLIGFTSFEDWLDSKDINHPNRKDFSKDEGYSLLEAVKFKHGQNAVRMKLLTTLSWLSAQGGL